MANENRIRGLVIGAMITSLFSFLLLLFVVNVGVNYDIPTSEFEGSLFNYTGLNQTLQNAQSTGETWKETFTKNPVSVITGALNPVQMFKLMSTMFKVIFSPLTIYMYIMEDVLNIPPVVTGTFVFIVIVTFIFAVWRVIRIGA